MFNRKVNDLKDYTKDMQETMFDEQTIDVDRLRESIEEYNNTTLPEIREQILETQRKDNEYFSRTHKVLKSPYPIGSTVMIKNIEGKKTKRQKEMPNILVPSKFINTLKMVVKS
jgi:hypothetical protein